MQMGKCTWLISRLWDTQTNEDNSSEVLKKGICINNTRGWKFWAPPPSLASGILSFDLQMRRVLDLPRAQFSGAWGEEGRPFREMIGLLKYPLGFWVTTDCPLHGSFIAVLWSFCLSFMTWEQNSLYCLALVLLEPLNPWILISCALCITSPVWPICPFLTMAISTRVLTSTAYRVAFPSRIS